MQYYQETRIGRFDDSLAKWSPMATEINRDEFLGISFSHHMEILHKTKNIGKYCFAFMKRLFTNGGQIYVERHFKGRHPPA